MYFTQYGACEDKLGTNCNALNLDLAASAPRRVSGHVLRILYNSSRQWRTLATGSAVGLRSSLVGSSLRVTDSFTYFLINVS